MSDLRIDSNSSINPTPINTETETESGVLAGSNTVEKASKDTISQSLEGEKKNILLKKPLTEPTLPGPSEEPFSLWELLNAIAGSKLNLQGAIEESELLKYSLEYDAPPSTYLSMQSKAILETMRAIDEAIKNAEMKTDEVMQNLTETLKEINAVIESQNDAINELQKGNETQQKQIEELIAAQKTYVDGLKALGATSDGNGVYTIPDTPEAQAEYARLTAEYQTAVDSFNQYWTTRVDEIEQYNAAAESYNTKATEINQKLTETLGPYVTNVPQLTLSPIIDISSATTPIPYPSQQEGNKIYVPPLPDYINDFADPLQIDALPIGVFNAIAIEAYVYAYFEKTLVDPLNTQLDAQMDVYTYQMFLMNQPQRGSEDDPMDTRLFFAQLLLLPEASLEITEKTASPANLKKMQIARILGADILKQFLDQNYADIEFKSSGLDKLSRLSMGHLSRSSNEALISILKKLGKSLTQLPENTSTLSLLLTLSFANNFIGQVRNGSLDQQIALQVSGISELSNLTPQGKKSLISIIKSDQLLLLGRFLEGHLGLTGFSNSLLAQLPPGQSSTILERVKEDNRESSISLAGSIKNMLKNQGLSDEKAQFLAEMGVNSLSAGWLTAPSLSTVSAELVNLSLLIDSVTASLVSSLDQSLSLNECASIAETAVNSVFSGSSSLSNASFRKALRSELDEMSMYKFSSNASERALTVPKELLSMGEMAGGENYFYSLLGSQLGREAATQFNSGASLLIGELSNNLLKELNSLPENIRNQLIINSMQNTAALQSVLSTFSNPSDVIMSALASNRELKINNNMLV